MGIERYYTTAGSNTDVDGINIAEGMAPSLVNNAMRQMVANVRKWFNDAEWVQFGSGDGPPDISYVSATSFTVNGVDVTDEYHAGRRVKAVGSSTGTIYGTIQSSDFVTNTTVTVDWDSGQLENEALEIYLAILRAENVSLPNSDAARATLGLGSMATQDADNVNITGGSASFTGSLSMESTAAGAAEGPVPELYRNRSAPSNNQDLGAIHFTGNDSGGNKHTFAAVEAAAETVTNGAEDGIIRLQTSRGGSVLAARLFVGAGVWTQGATGTDPGAGKINAQEYLVNGQPLSSTLEVADAWVRFNGRTATIASSHGVSSLIEQGPSDYQVNWDPVATTNAYAPVACGGIAPGGEPVTVWFTSASTTNLRVRTRNATGFNEPDAICVAIFGAF